MARVRRTAFLAQAAWVVTAQAALAQDLVPGAYTPAPVGINVVTLAVSPTWGGLAFDPTVPVEAADARLWTTALGYIRTLNIKGRFASASVLVPYSRGRFEGLVFGEPQQAVRSGLSDPVVRLAVNLVGAPAMTPREFATYQPTAIVGVSFTASVPVGQYFPDKFINLGRNRWSFRPEIGWSLRRGRWTFETAAGTTFFTDNDNYVDGGTLSQSPIVAVQGHLIYAIRLGYWVAVDGNFWSGGRLTTSGREATEKLDNSRLGVTLAVPIARQQVRIAYSFGLHTSLGGDFQAVGVSYSYAWAARRQ